MGSHPAGGRTEILEARVTAERERCAFEFEMN